MYTAVIQIIVNSLLQVAKPQRGVYVHLYEAIKSAIVQGQIPPDTVMPPTRVLSEKIGLSRSTVVKAYGLLCENLFIEARYGSNYKVAPVQQDRVVISRPAESYPSISAVGQSFLQNIDLLNDSSDGVAFTPGLPPLDIFPISQWQKLTNSYWRNVRSADLNYSASSGIDSLKKNISNYLLITRKIKCDPNQIIIVSGSLQSLYLIGNVMVDNGDTVCLENPTFPNVISIFQSLRAHVIPVNIDREGLLVQDMESDEHKKAKLIHTTPSNQYPLGGKMSLQRRLALLKWADENNSMVIENDYEHEINNWDDPIESLFSLDKHQRTIYLGTFNRILHPSIRLGYMLVPPYLLPAIKALQMHSHRFVPQSIQVVMTEFMQQNHLLKHIHKVIDEAEERRKLFIDLFQKLFSDQLEIKTTDTRSFHLLVQPTTETKDQDIVDFFRSSGINTHAVSKCYLSTPEHQGLIMGYSSINRVFIAQYLHRMATLLKARKP